MKTFASVPAQSKSPVFTKTSYFISGIFILFSNFHELGQACLGFIGLFN